MKYSEAKQYLKEGMTVRVITHESYSGNYAGKKYKIDAVGSGDITNLAFNCIGGPLIYQDDEFEILTNPDGSKWEMPGTWYACESCFKVVDTGKICVCHTSTPKFKVGDRVRVHKPKDINEYPYWNSRMDEYDNTVHKISKISKISNYIELENSGWSFNPKWLELVEEPRTYGRGLLETSSMGIYEPDLVGDLLRYEMMTNGFKKLYYSDSDITPLFKKKGFMSNIVQKIKDLALSETDRILRKHGFEDQNGERMENADDMMDEELLQERWLTRRDAIAADLAKIDAEEKKSC